MIIIEEISVISHLGRPALSLRIDKGQESESPGSNVDTRHLVHIYEFDELPVTITNFIERLRWLISRLNLEYS